MHPEITVRAAKDSDLSGIRNLLFQVNQIHADGRPDLFKSGGIKYTDEELLSIFQDPRRPVLVALDREQVLGYAFCIFEETAETTSLRPVRTLYLDDLCINESRRGEGLGRRLYDEVIRLAEAAGCDRITLHAWNFNQKAFRFYEKLGMTPLVTTMEQRLPIRSAD